jgi:hypothetical protein
MGADSASHETRVAEHKAKIARAASSEPHASVAHVNADALRYLEAAEKAIEEGNNVHALYLVGVAEGIANALADVAGLAGVREAAVREMVSKRVIEVRLLVGPRA